MKLMHILTELLIRIIRSMRFVVYDPKGDDGELHIEATVKDTGQLRWWWLLGFGDYVEVLEPIELRKEFEDISRNMDIIYN